MNTSTNDTVRIVPVIDNEPDNTQLNNPSLSCPIHSESWNLKIFADNLKAGRMEALQGIGRYLSHAVSESITLVEFMNGQTNGIQDLKSKLEIVLEYCNQHINS